MSSAVIDDRIYLNVAKEEKEGAKALGAKWDSKEVSWYTTTDNPKNKTLFATWGIKEQAATQQTVQTTQTQNATQTQKPQSIEQSERIYIAVPKEEKEGAKALGAKWDKDEKSWYTTTDNIDNAKLFAKWSIKMEESPVQKAKQTQTADVSPRIFINVFKEEKEGAKALGARWDNKEVSWYTTADNPNNAALFAKWKPVEAGMATSNFSKIKEFFGSVSSLNEVLAMKPEEKQRLVGALNVLVQTISPDNSQVKQQSSRMKA